HRPPEPELADALRRREQRLERARLLGRERAPGELVLALVGREDLAWLEGELGRVLGAPAGGGRTTRAGREREEGDRGEERAATHARSVDEVGAHRRASARATTA